MGVACARVVATRSVRALELGSHVVVSKVEVVSKLEVGSHTHAHGVWLRFCISCRGTRIPETIDHVQEPEEGASFVAILAVLTSPLLTCERVRWIQ